MVLSFFRRTSLTGCLLFAMLPAMFLFAASYAQAKSALDISLYTLENKRLSLKDVAKGKPIYLKLWATWCKDCIAQMPHFEQTYRNVGQDIEVIAVNVGLNDSNSDIKDLMRRQSLTMPVLVDKHGELAQELDLLGTPLHILIDAQGRIVHKGYAADADIDQKISILSSGSLAAIPSPDKETTIPPLFSESAHDVSVVLFTATWCDWYLEDTRPKMANNCRSSAEFLEQAYKSKELTKVNWLLLASRLWTGQSDLDEFVAKYHLKIPAQIDQSNLRFFDHQIRDFPVLIVFRSGEELGRIHDFADKNVALRKLKGLVN
ncbi:redoxin domain-containing protein [Agaribacterium sp. ZY112]|uniref:redoxin domain-containing protein n=1 Tax=Agaribacterium sp. ZY112 TaxID=3233574 RepID=UPI003525EE0B